MTLLLLSFIAGILTVLAPCVLPLLPIIIGGSLGGRSKWYPYIVTASLAFSIVIFTLLLKVSTSLINIDPYFWKVVSGGLILVFGFIYIFPELWDRISLKLQFANRSDTMLHKAKQKEGFLQPILIGAALSPVFASCSPTYALIIATVLPVNISEGILYIFVYALGLSLVMLLVALLGRQFIKSAKWAVDPQGLFRKLLGAIFIIVGVAVLTGVDKQIETALLTNGIFDVTQVEQRLLEEKNNSSSSKTSSSNSSSLFNQSYPAPEIVGIQNWINSSGISLKDLKGKVVLIDFWTYSCINCQSTLLYVTKWYDTYKDQGLVVLGIHAPEFSFEKKVENVEQAVRDAKIKYPVGLDNDFATWNAYKNQFWPAKYLIDREGTVRLTHFGEGKYADTEEAIRLLLQEKSTSNLPTKVVTQDTVQTNTVLTPETYLGYTRGERFVNTKEFIQNAKQNYSGGETLNNTWALQGAWTIGEESVTSEEDTNLFKMSFTAKNMYLVMSSETESTIRVITDNPGKDVVNATVKIQKNMLYTLVESETSTNKTIQVIVPKGVKLYAVTFG